MHLSENFGFQLPKVRFPGFLSQQQRALLHDHTITYIIAKAILRIKITS